MPKSVIHDGIPVELDDGIDEALLDAAPDATERDGDVDAAQILQEELATAGEEVEA